MQGRECTFSASFNQLKLRNIQELARAGGLPRRTLPFFGMRRAITPSSTSTIGNNAEMQFQPGLTATRWLHDERSSVPAIASPAKYSLAVKFLPTQIDSTARLFIVQPWPPSSFCPAHGVLATDHDACRRGPPSRHKAVQRFGPRESTRPDPSQPREHRTFWAKTAKRSANFAWSRELFYDCDRHFRGRVWISDRTFAETLRGKQTYDYFDGPNRNTDDLAA